MEKYGWLSEENLCLIEKIPYNKHGDMNRYVIMVGGKRCEQIENNKASAVALIAGKDSVQYVDGHGLVFLKAGIGTVQIVGEVRERKVVERKDANKWFQFSVEGGFQRVHEDYVLECLSVEDGEFEKYKPIMILE